jgi:hypothetical protein
VGLAVHIRLSRRPIACSLPSLLAAARGAVQLQRIPGEWAAPVRWSAPHATLALAQAQAQAHVWNVFLEKIPPLRYYPRKSPAQ